MKKAVMVWSGGKDSALALQAVRQNSAYEVVSLLTTANEHHRRVSMHGVRVALIERQAQELGLPLAWVWVPEAPDMAVYEERMREGLLRLKAAGVTVAIFGDIFLGDLRKYREQQMADLGLEAVFPVWGRNTADLVRQFVAQGFRAVVVCTSQRVLPASFCGRFLDQDFIAGLPLGVDPCGENGEYHSFVFDGPLFAQAIPVQLGENVLREYGKPAASETDTSGPPAPDSGFWFCDLTWPAYPPEKF